MVYQEGRESATTGADPAATYRWRTAEDGRQAGLDAICLAEGTLWLFPKSGYMIDSDPDYGHRMIGGRRTVLLWSRRPWREVDRAGDPEMPGGRFMSRVTETPVGNVPVVGVCIPWEGPHVGTKRKDRPKWEDHLQSIGGLERYLLGFGVGQEGGDRRVPVLVAGDFNQTIPRTRAPVDAYETLIRSFEGRDFVTAGRGGIDHVALDGRLRALRVQRWQVGCGGGKRAIHHAG